MRCLVFLFLYYKSLVITGNLWRCRVFSYFFKKMRNIIQRCPSVSVSKMNVRWTSGGGRWCRMPTLDLILYLPTGRCLLCGKNENKIWSLSHPETRTTTNSHTYTFNKVLTAHNTVAALIELGNTHICWCECDKMLTSAVLAWGQEWSISPTPTLLPLTLKSCK